VKDGVGHVPVQREALGGLVLLVPAEREPVKALVDRLQRRRGIAFDVGVVDAQDDGAAIVAGVEPVEDEGAGAPDVQKAGGGRREANSQHGKCQYNSGTVDLDT